MRFELPKLPYAYEELEPVISRKIMELHHGKHHAGYVKNANALLEKLEKSRRGEIEIDVGATLKSLSFNANGAIMHEIFWHNMRKPRESNLPDGEIAELINKCFGSFEAMKKEFSSAAKSVEGSGWATLAYGGNGNLAIMQVEKHNLMHMAGFKPILVLDVWEHAFYLDYLNDKGSYVEKWWSVVNWEDVGKRI